MDGERLFNKGLACMEVSCCCCGPNYNDALEYFTEAAEFYTRHADISKAYEHAAVCYEALQLKGSAALHYVKAATEALQDRSFNDVVRLLDEAKTIYLEIDSPVSIVRHLKNFIQQVELRKPEIAFQLYNSLVEVIETCDIYYWNNHVFIERAVLAAKLNKPIFEICQCWKRAQHAYLELEDFFNAAHCISSELAYILQANDLLLAFKTFQEYTKLDWFARTNDFIMMDEFIRGLQSKNEKLLYDAKNEIAIVSLNPEVSDILHNLSSDG